jgi:hypothetical protein
MLLLIPLLAAATASAGEVEVVTEIQAMHLFGEVRLNIVTSTSGA